MGKLIEPRILGFNPVDADTSALFVADKDNNEYKVFDSEGELYTPDGGVVSDRLDALESGIPPIDDARIVVLENAKAQNDLDVADLQGRMTTAESDIDAVEVTVAAEQLLLDQAQTDITNLQGDMTTAQADIVTAKGVADATTIVANAHVAKTDNPHAVTHAQVGADAAGTAATAVSNHVAAADPHAQYLKKSPSASDVDALPVSDANNVFTGSTIGDQLQQAGVQLAQYASNIVVKNALNPDWTAQMGLYNDGVTPKGFTISSQYNDDFVQIVESAVENVDFADKNMDTRMFWNADGDTFITIPSQLNAVGADATGPYYIKAGVKTYF